MGERGPERSGEVRESGMETTSSGGSSSTARDVGGFAVAATRDEARRESITRSLGGTAIRSR